MPREVAGVFLQARVGAGGEGEVWAARRPDGSVCALKLIRPAGLAPPATVAERGRWLVRIDHPNLVRVTRGGRIRRGPLAGWGFVEMDLIAGESLTGHGPDPAALRLLRGVADGLDHLHAGRWSDGVPLVHRDVKPGNLIAAADHVVLVDPSTLRGADAVDLTRVGTPVYAAPEVLSGRFGPAADRYSLAVTAAALLTGARGRTLQQVVADPAGWDLPAGVRAGLAPSPGARPATCRAVVEERRAAPITGLDVPRGGAGRWLAALTGLVLAPSAVWAGGWVTSRQALAGAAAAVAAHLIIHLKAGRPLAGLVCPPAAWADLLATRTPHPERRRAWLRCTITGALTAAAVAAVLLGRHSPALAAAAAAAGVATTGAALRAATRRGLLGLLLRSALLPLTIAGGPLVALAGPRRALAGALLEVLRGPRASWPPPSPAPPVQEP